MFNKKTTFKSTFKSVASALIGVQSNKNREKDFSQGKLSYFILAGILGVIIFISVLITLVYLVIPN